MGIALRCVCCSSDADCLGRTTAFRKNTAYLSKCAHKWGPLVTHPCFPAGRSKTCMSLRPRTIVAGFPPFSSPGHICPQEGLCFGVLGDGAQFTLRGGASQGLRRATGCTGGRVWPCSSQGSGPSAWCPLTLQGAERKIRDEERKQSKRKGKCPDPSQGSACK